MIDFLLGCLLITFTLYLISALKDNITDIHVSWLAFGCCILGFLLFLTSIFSFCAVASTNCRMMAHPTDYLAILIVVLDFALGVTAVKLEPIVRSYLDSSGKDVGLSDSDISTIKTWYIAIWGSLFASLFLEVLRVWFNRGFADTSKRMDREYANLLDEENRQWDEKLEDNKVHTIEKYKKLRDHYRDKYNRPFPSDPEAAYNSQQQNNFM
jgi:hypothetical protein